MKWTFSASSRCSDKGVSVRSVARLLGTNKSTFARHCPHVGGLVSNDQNAFPLAFHAVHRDRPQVRPDRCDDAFGKAEGAGWTIRGVHTGCARRGVRLSDSRADWGFVRDLEEFRPSSARVVAELSGNSRAISRLAFWRSIPSRADCTRIVSRANSTTRHRERARDPSARIFCDTLKPRARLRDDAAASRPDSDNWLKFSRAVAADSDWSRASRVPWFVGRSGRGIGADN